ncbi:MAG: META domain-containing protein [Muribaculaceae bacterium]|nr:META domain-containing protein [Muribaculaceae bacterium]
MKNGRYILIAAGAAMMMSLGSCNVVTKVTDTASSWFKPKTNSKNNEVSLPESKQKADSKSKNKSESKQKDDSSAKGSGKDVSQDVVLPHDREQIAAHKEVRTYTPEEIAQGVVKGDWAIEQVNGRNAVGEKAPFLKFSPSEKRFYGNNGCNSITGSYTYNPADSTLRFSNIAATMMLCSKEGITDYEINAALDAARTYVWTEKGGDYYIHLLDGANREVMTLMHQNFDFLNGVWGVSMINDKPIDNPDVQLVIDVDENKIHGNTGCNILNGAMETDMEAANSISFNSIATTKMACPPGDNTETEFIVALEEASTAKPISAKEVLLFDSMGNPVLKLVRK